MKVAVEQAKARLGLGPYSGSHPKFVQTPNVRCPAMLEEAEHFSKYMRQFLTSLDAYESQMDKFFTRLPRLLRGTVPRVWESVEGGLSEPVRPHISHEHSALIGSEHDPQLMIEYRDLMHQRLHEDIERPIERWLSGLTVVKKRMTNLEKLRADLDSHRRRAEKRLRRAERKLEKDMESSSSSDDEVVERQREIEDYSRKALMEDRNLQAIRASYEDQERLIFEQLSGLVRDAAWLKSYVVATFLVVKEALQATIVALGPTKQPLPGFREHSTLASVEYGSIADNYDLAMEMPELTEAILRRRAPRIAPYQEVRAKAVVASPLQIQANETLSPNMVLPSVARGAAEIPLAALEGDASRLALEHSHPHSIRPGTPDRSYNFMEGGARGQPPPSPRYGSSRYDVSPRHYQEDTSQGLFRDQQMASSGPPAYEGYDYPQQSSSLHPPSGRHARSPQRGPGVYQAQGTSYEAPVNKKSLSDRALDIVREMGHKPLPEFRSVSPTQYESSGTDRPYEEKSTAQRIAEGVLPEAVTRRITGDKQSTPYEQRTGDYGAHRPYGEKGIVQRAAETVLPEAVTRTFTGDRQSTADERQAYREHDRQSQREAGVERPYEDKGVVQRIAEMVVPEGVSKRVTGDKQSTPYEQRTGEYGTHRSYGEKGIVQRAAETVLPEAVTRTLTGDRRSPREERQAYTQHHQHQTDTGVLPMLSGPLPDVEHQVHDQSSAKQGREDYYGPRETYLGTDRPYEEKSTAQRIAEGVLPEAVTRRITGDKQSTPYEQRTGDYGTHGPYGEKGIVQRAAETVLPEAVTRTFTGDRQSTADERQAYREYDRQSQREAGVERPYEDKGVVQRIAEMVVPEGVSKRVTGDKQSTPYEQRTGDYGTHRPYGEKGIVQRAAETVLPEAVTRTFTGDRQTPAEERHAYREQQKASAPGVERTYEDKGVVQRVAETVLPEAIAKRITGASSDDTYQQRDVDQRGVDPDGVGMGTHTKGISGGLQTRRGDLSPAGVME